MGIFLRLAGVVGARDNLADGGVDQSRVRGFVDERAMDGVTGPTTFDGGEVPAELRATTR